MKVLFGHFSNRTSYASSIFGNLARKVGWDTEFQFFRGSESDEEIAEILIQSGPDLLGLSMKTYERKAALQVARVAKSLGIKIITGGPHPTNAPGDLKTLDLFDGIVVGDGLGVLEEILDSHESLSGEVILGKRHADMKLYTERYFDPEQEAQMRETKMFTVIGSLGCPFSCNYCATTRSPAYIPVEDVVNSIEKAKRDYGIEWVAFLDDTFTYSIKKLRKFHEAIRERELKFEYMEVKTRVDCFTDEVADEIAGMGVEEISFGVETASPRLLKFLDKGCTLEDNYKAAEICKSHGLSMRINLMYGIPTQDKDDYEITQKYVEDCEPSSVTPFYFTPFPGTGMFKYCVDNGYLPVQPENWSFDNFQDMDINTRGFEGYKHTKGMLRKIDYGMAEHYYKKVLSHQDQKIEDVVLDTARKVDGEPWIVVGTKKYFSIVLEKLSRRNWDNLVGCYNLVDDDYQQLNLDIDVPAIDPDNLPVGIKNVMVTLHKGHYFDEVIVPTLREKFNFEGQVFSVSTWPDRSANKIPA
jgi:radical SAM superfamily enzyme YgiQ (UPF0313 family)